MYENLEKGRAGRKSWQIMLRNFESPVLVTVTHHSLQSRCLVLYFKRCSFLNRWILFDVLFSPSSVPRAPVLAGGGSDRLKTPIVLRAFTRTFLSRRTEFCRTRRTHKRYQRVKRWPAVLFGFVVICCVIPCACGHHNRRQMNVSCVHRGCVHILSCSIVGVPSRCCLRIRWQMRKCYTETLFFRSPQGLELQRGNKIIGDLMPTAAARMVGETYPRDHRLKKHGIVVLQRQGERTHFDAL